MGALWSSIAAGAVVHARVMTAVKSTVMMRQYFFIALNLMILYDIVHGFSNFDWIVIIRGGDSKGDSNFGFSYSIIFNLFLPYYSLYFVQEVQQWVKV